MWNTLTISEFEQRGIIQNLELELYILRRVEEGRVDYLRFWGPHAPSNVFGTKRWSARKKELCCWEGQDSGLFRHFIGVKVRSCIMLLSVVQVFALCFRGNEMVLLQVSFFEFFFVVYFFKIVMFSKPINAMFARIWKERSRRLKERYKYQVFPASSHLASWFKR